MFILLLSLTILSPNSSDKRPNMFPLLGYKSSIAVNKILNCFLFFITNKFSLVQLLSRVQLFAIPWTPACQDSLPITNSRSLLKLMSIESMMPSNHLILCHPLLLPPSIFPSIRGFSNESVLCIWPNSGGISASASILPMNIQD